MAGGQSGSRRSGKRLLGIAFLVLFVLLCIAGVAGYFALNRQPGYWSAQQQRIAAMSEQQREQISEALFNRATTQWSEAPDNATTIEDLIGLRGSLEVSYEELNVWLADAGIELLADIGIELPKSVKGAMIDSPGEGLLRISCDIEKKNFKQVVALIFDIAVDEKGIVVSELKSASAGLLPLPTKKAVDMIAKHSGENDLMTALLRGTPTGPIDVPIDASNDGLRDGRLVGFEVLDDKLIITRQTVLRQKKD